MLNTIKVSIFLFFSTALVAQQNSFVDVETLQTSEEKNLFEWQGQAYQYSAKKNQLSIGLANKTPFQITIEGDTKAKVGTPYKFITIKESLWLITKWEYKESMKAYCEFIAQKVDIENEQFDSDPISICKNAMFGYAKTSIDYEFVYECQNLLMEISQNEEYLIIAYNTGGDHTSSYYQKLKVMDYNFEVIEDYTVATYKFNTTPGLANAFKVSNTGDVVGMYKVSNFAEDKDVIPNKPKENAYVVSKFSKGEQTILKDAPKIYDFDNHRFLLEGVIIYYAKISNVDGVTNSEISSYNISTGEKGVVKKELTLKEMILYNIPKEQEHIVNKINRKDGKSNIFFRLIDFYKDESGFYLISQKCAYTDNGTQVIYETIMLDHFKDMQSAGTRAYLPCRSITSSSNTLVQYGIHSRYFIKAFKHDDVFYVLFNQETVNLNTRFKENQKPRAYTSGSNDIALCVGRLKPGEEYQYAEITSTKKFGKIDILPNELEISVSDKSYITIKTKKNNGVFYLDWK